MPSYKANVLPPSDDQPSFPCPHVFGPGLACSATSKYTQQLTNDSTTPFVSGKMYKENAFVCGEMSGKKKYFVSSEMSFKNTCQW